MIRKQWKVILGKSTFKITKPNQRYQLVEDLKDTQENFPRFLDKNTKMENMRGNIWFTDLIVNKENYPRNKRKKFPRSEEYDF